MISFFPWPYGAFKQPKKGRDFVLNRQGRGHDLIARGAKARDSQMDWVGRETVGLGIAQASTAPSYQGPAVQKFPMTKAPMKKVPMAKSALALGFLMVMAWASPKPYQMGLGKIHAEQILERIMTSSLAKQPDKKEKFLEKPALEKEKSPFHGLALHEAIMLLVDVIQKILHNHPHPPSVGEFLEAALRGVCAQADAHTAYLTPEEFREMQDHTSGELQGVGLELTREEGQGLRVIAAIDDTPAHKAGMKSGDLIVAVGASSDESKKTIIAALSISEAVRRIRGKAGTQVVLWIKREGERNLLIIKMLREKIQIRSVKSRLEGPDVLYLRISTFDAKTAPMLREALIKARNQHPSIKGYILDLRSNPGGLLDQSIAVTSLFVDKGTVVQMRGRNPKDNEVSSVIPGQKIALDLPLVILIDQGTASASEIVAGALQDLGRAFVMGVPSFGKGSVQTIAPISLGGKEMGAIKLTIKRFYTPLGRPIQGHGIVPDFHVAAVKSITYDTSPEVREANLPGILCPEKSGPSECSVLENPSSGGQKPCVQAVPLGEATCEGPEFDLPLDLARKMVTALWGLKDRGRGAGGNFLGSSVRSSSGKPGAKPSAAPAAGPSRKVR
jgi:carboxyl-terminal processing protease